MLIGPEPSIEGVFSGELFGSRILCELSAWKPDFERMLVFAFEIFGGFANSPRPPDSKSAVRRFPIVAYAEDLVPGFGTNTISANDGVCVHLGDKSACIIYERR
jgi:hypothetical protein